MTSDHLAPAEPSTASTARRPRRWPLVLLLVLVAVGGVGGLAGVYLYNQATTPDRSDPEVTVRQFLTAVFVEKDDVRAGLFVCPTAATSPIQVARELVDPDATPSWDSVVVTEKVDKQAKVSIRMRYRYSGELAASGQELWQFELADDDGWRVCAVTHQP